MSEQNAFDIEKAFAESFKDCAPQDTGDDRDAYPYSSFNACRYQGTLIGKIIPAMSKGKMAIYKTLNNVLIGSIPFKRDDGQGEYYRGVRVVDSSEYECELTNEQRSLNEKLIEQLNTYNKLVVEKGGSQWEPIKKKRVSFFYMMIRRYIDQDEKKTDYTDPNVTCVYHQSFRFGEKFNAAVNKRTQAKESNAWLMDYFKNSPGMNQNFVLITTKRPEFAYEIDFSFEELPAIKFEVKEDDLRTAASLDEAFVNTLAYDYDFYKEIYDRVKELNDSMTNDPTIVDAPELDRTNHNVE